MPDLEPTTREEKLLDGEDLTPITRKEMFIKRIYDKTQSVPEPVTREEMFLKKAGEGGGGDIDLQTLTVTENGEQDAPSGVAYNKVITNVPAPSNAIYKQTLSNLPSPIATFTGADAPLDSLKASIVGVQSGSGDPSPSNVRPLTGWTSCEVTRTGKNLLDDSSPLRGYYNRSGVLVNSDKSVSYYINLPAGIYTFSTNLQGCTITRYLINDVNTDLGLQSQSYTFNLVNDSNLKVTISRLDAEVISTTPQTMIERGDVATTYEPYNGNTYTIPFKDSSDNHITVYDGDVDVANGGGKSNFSYIELPSTGWVQEGDKIGVFTNYAVKADTSYPQLICSHAVRAFSYNDVINNEGKIGLSTSRILWHTTFATVEELEQYLANNTVQIAYKLATPTTMQFDPIALRSNGVTNISVNCGEITECKYYSETP